MNIAVYNKASHIRTMGGGEKVMAVLLKTLRERYEDVTLLTEEEIDLGLFKQKFNIDITNVNLEVLPSEFMISRRTKDFDLFFNVSHGVTNLLGRAKCNIHYISFPLEISLKFLKLNPLFHSFFKSLIELTYSEAVRFDVVEGFEHLHALGGKLGRVWSQKIQDNFKIIAENSSSGKLHLVFNVPLKKDEIEQYLTIKVNDSVASFSVSNKSIIIETGSQEGKYLEIEGLKDKKLYKKNLFEHSYLTQITQVEPQNKLLNRLYLSIRSKESILKAYDFINSYQILLSNSNYTKSWTNKYWGKDPITMYPPCEIDLPEVKEKKNQIITIGRFFEGEHNKKHVPMVYAFRQLVDKYGLQGWELHMCGGTLKEHVHQKYLRKVKYLAQGYPVHIHEDISFRDLAKLLSESKLFWHATGFGEDEDKDPLKFEHFGITTVEAMVGQTVPLVINKAGQKETVEHEKSGYLWNNLEELQRYTNELAHNEELLNKMQDECITRSKEFDNEAFAQDIEKIIQKALTIIDKK